MDIFWQITVIQSLQNVAVFAVAVIAFGLVRQGVARLRPAAMRYFNEITGLLMGLATAVAFLLPVHMSGGASTGSETILLALAGLMAGPIAAVLATVLACAAQIVPVLRGEPFDPLSLSMIITAAGAGVAFHLVLRRNGGKADISHFHFPLLGLLCAVLGLGCLWIFQGWGAVLYSALAAVLAGVLAASAIGTLLLHETRRDEAEMEVRKSEARLAKQAKELAAQAFELAAARDAAERANEAKSAFLANMSHELRTPLNAILGFSEMMLQECYGPLGADRYKEYSSDIHTSGAHLLSLINDLLDVAKIEAGRMEISPTPIDTRRAFDIAFKLIAVKAREKNQKLMVSIAPDAPPLYADERALKQILINLATNAVKFTPEGGTIQIRASKAEDGGFQIVCEDNGPGIPPEKLERVFTPFSQIDNRYDRQEGGTGLGLSLVRGLMNLHGGRVWLESELGEGVRAYVVFPPQPAMVGKSVVAA